MSEVENVKEATKKATKAAAARVESEAEKFAANTAQFPEMFREMAEKSVEQAKESYTRMRGAAEQATDMVEDTYLNATRGATELNLKAIDAMRANINANLDYARSLLAARSFSEAMELSASHMRQQFEALSEQTKDFSALAQKVASETSEPLKSNVSKNFQIN